MLAAFFDSVPFYAGILNPEGRLVEIGRVALEACGYTRTQVIGQLFWESAWWRGCAEAQVVLQQAFARCRNGQAYRATLTYVFADDTKRWVDFSMSPVMDGDRLVQAIVLGTDITARVNAEAEVVAVRRRLDSALMTAEVATYEWDVVSDRLFADRNLERIFGVPLDAEGAAPLARFITMIHPDDQARVIARVQHSVVTGENFEEDYRVMSPDGTQRVVNSRGRMLKDAAGKVTSFVGMLMDITRRHQAEQERKAIAQRLRKLTAIHETVLSATNDFAYVFDLEGRFLYANRPLCALYGRPLEEVVGRTFIQLGYPAWHAEMHLREIARVIATRQPIQGEIPFRGESGISGIYDYIFTPVFGADGRVEAVAGTTRDVSDRKRGEARDRLLVALDDATRPLIDPQGITHAAARLLGEHLGVNRCAYADVEDDEDTFNLTGDFNRDVPSIVGRYRFTHFGAECLRLMREGRPFVVEDVETDPRTADVRESYRATQIGAVICVPLHKAGRFVAAMAVHQNGVRRWQPSEVETVIAVANRSWESIERSRVVRVLAESEQRLSRAVDEAVRASRAKDDFLATLSHELRTPLNPVLLLASEAARDPQLSPAVRESFATIRKNVELEARLIDDLLDLTAIVRGKLVIRKEVRDLHTILADAIASVQPEFQEKGIALHVDLGEGKPLVLVDEVRMAQVFINLLKNAVKFTPAKGNVTLQVRPHAPGTTRVRLTDDGIGMTAGELGRVFDAFEQGEHAADGSGHRFGGLGLGLAICQRLLGLHGGDITATSAGRGQGAAFTVRLPLHAGAETELTGAKPASHSPGSALPASGIHILLVEDHEATRKALEQLLVRRGYRVTVAATLAEARAQAARHEIDLLVSDIGLPDGDGAALMAELRARRGLKGIALTGYGMDEDIAHCRAAGFGAHLTKPIRVEALDTVLREMLGAAGHAP